MQTGSKGFKEMTNWSGEYKGKQYEFRELNADDHFINETRAWHLLTPKAGEGHETARFESLEELKVCIDIFSDGVGSNKTTAKHKHFAYAIVSYAMSCHAVELFDAVNIYFIKNGERIEKFQIVHEYSNYILAKQNLARAQELEKQMRVMWQAAIEHAGKLENLMQQAVYGIMRDES